MMLHQIIKTLQAAAAERPENATAGPLEIIELVYGRHSRIAMEHRNREGLVRNVMKAKHDAGAPLDSVFFRDVWPEALAALLIVRAADANAGELAELIKLENLPPDDEVTG